MKKLMKKLSKKLLILIAVAFIFRVLVIGSMGLTGAKKFSANGSEPRNTPVIGQAEINEDVIIFQDKEGEKIQDSVKELINNNDGTYDIVFSKKLGKNIKELKAEDIFLLEPTTNLDHVLYNGFAAQVINIDEGSKRVRVIQADFQDVYKSFSLDEDADLKMMPSIEYVQLGSDAFSYDPSTRRAAGRSISKDKTKVGEKVEVNLGDNAKLASTLALNSAGKGYFKELNFEIKDLAPFSKVDSQEESLKDNITINANINLADLFVKFKYLPSIPLNLAAPSMVDFEIATDLKYDANINFNGFTMEKEKNIPLAYARIQLGLIPGQASVGNPINQTLGLGIFISCDLEGKITVDAKFEFSHEAFINSGFKAKKGLLLYDVETLNNKAGVNYPHPYLPEKGGDVNDLEPTTTLGLTAEAKGEMNIFIPIKGSLYLLNYDLLAMEYKNGLEGALALTTDATLKFDGDKQHNKCEGGIDTELSCTLDFLGEFKITSGIIDLAQEIFSENNANNEINLLDKELYRINLINFKLSNKVKFDGNMIELYGDPEVSRQYADVNNDNIDDVFICYGKEAFGINYITDVVVLDGENNEILTSFIAPVMTIELVEIKDFTGDGVKDIIFSNHTGGQRGGFSTHLIYKDETFKEGDFEEEIEFQYSYLDDFNIGCNVPDLNKNLVLDMSKDKEEEYIEFKVYESNGKYVGGDEYTLVEKYRGGYLKDMDNDGILEYVKTAGIGSYEMYGGEGVCIVNRVYKYVDNKFKLIDVFLEGI